MTLLTMKTRYNYRYIFDYCLIAKFTFAVDFSCKKNYTIPGLNKALLNKTDNIYFN